MVYIHESNWINIQDNLRITFIPYLLPIRRISSAISEYSSK